MEKTSYRYSTGLVSGLFLVLALILPIACTQKTLEHYSARGLVVSVEQGAEGHSYVTILHEAVRDFKDQTGKVVGMQPMAMTFVADRTIPTKDLQPQAKIQFVFEVHWESAERLVLKEMKPLDSATKLELGGYSVEMA